jgi:hypothetical protein
MLNLVVVVVEAVYARLSLAYGSDVNSLSFLPFPPLSSLLLSPTFCHSIYLSIPALKFHSSSFNPPSSFLSSSLSMNQILLLFLSFLKLTFHSFLTLTSHYFLALSLSLSALSSPFPYTHSSIFFSLSYLFSSLTGTGTTLSRSLGRNVAFLSMDNAFIQRRRLVTTSERRLERCGRRLNRMRIWKMHMRIK